MLPSKHIEDAESLLSGTGLFFVLLSRLAVSLARSAFLVSVHLATSFVLVCLRRAPGRFLARGGLVLDLSAVQGFHLLYWYFRQ